MQARREGKKKEESEHHRILSIKTYYKNAFLKVLIGFLTGVENEEEVHQAIIHGNTVKFYRVFPWEDDRMLIRLFPHFTDGGAKFLRNYTKEKNKNELMVQPEPKLLSSANKKGLWILNNFLKNPQLFTFILFMVRFPDKTQHVL